MRKVMVMVLALTIASVAFGQKSTKKAKAPAQTDDQKAAMAVVHQFVDSFDKGDVKSAVATCADNASIIDEFPPYNWQGCQNWADTYGSVAKQEDLTDGHVTLSKPLHVDVKGDRAYIVVPASFSYKQKGKLKSEPNARFTLALQKQGDTWKIVAWAWGKQ
jgi:ketosteroid isomerase-like protein